MDYQSILQRIEENHAKRQESHINSNVLLVDGLNTFLRAFAAVPTSNDNGDHIGGVTGFLHSIGYAIRLHNATRCIVVFDGAGGSLRRRKVFGGYKEGRRAHGERKFNRAFGFNTAEEEDKSRTNQFMRLLAYLETLPISVMCIDQVEADDVIAYVSQTLLPDSDITIMSADKDFMQLVSDRITVWNPTKKTLYTVDRVKEDLEIYPNNLLQFRMIEGDKSDNIPGVLGVGKKTLQKLIPEMFDSMSLTTEDILNKAKAVLVTQKSKALQTLVDSEKLLEMNYTLMQLTDVDISGHAKQKVMDSIRMPVPMLAKYQFMQMYSQDKMWTAIKNPDTWLISTFGRLNSFAAESQIKTKSVR